MKDYEDKVLEGVYCHIAKRHVENVANAFDELSDDAEQLAYPDELDDWFADYIKRVRARNKRKKLMKNIRLIAKRVAVFLIVITLGFTVTALSVEAFRVRLFNFVTEVSEKYTAISFTKESGVSYPEIDWQAYYVLQYIPEGYSYQSSEKFGDLKIIFYANTLGQEIQFSQTILNTNYQADTENAEVADVNVNGEKGLLIKKAGRTTIVWAEAGMTFNIIGELDDSEIKKMAESIKFFKK